MADDNNSDLSPEMNHNTTTVVLWANGSTGTIEFKELKDKGILEADAEWLIVGPDSPDERLQKLSLD